MTVYGPSQFNQINRLQPVDGERNDDTRDDKKKRSVLYQGRSWSETEEDLPIQPKPPSEEKKHSKQSHGVYADQVLLERAQKFFEKLTTLEDKVAQLCFYETEAIYEAENQQTIEWIQRYQMGGLLFARGDYKRQAYLIEHYQSLSNTPLLIGNDFLHSLSFYFQGEMPPTLFQQTFEEKRLSDLGQAVMAQNRRLGVHFQFDCERKKMHQTLQMELSEAQRRAFRQGIRSAQGLVAKEKSTENQALLSKLKSGEGNRVSLGSLVAPMMVEYAQETIGMKNVNVLDMVSEVHWEEKLLAAFKEPYDIFLFGENLPQAIAFLTAAVQSGKIREEELEKRVLRVLLMKAAFFKT